MNIHCPHCNHPMELKGVRAGRFTPACTVCKQRFQLTISPDAAVEPVVEKIDATTASVSTAPASATAVAVQQVKQASSMSVTSAPPPRAPSASASSDTPPAIGLSAPAMDVARTVHDASSPKPQAVDTEDAPPLSGALGGYEIVKMLGRGGMGSVYLARQVSLDRNVALKTLAPKFATDPEFINRFTREAYAAAQLTHHNVVQIHDIGEARQTNFFSMEFVEGQSLADVIKSEGAIDPEIAAGYTLQAARGLKFAHDHGMIHRDVKPENLLLNEQGVVKVADLGLVKRAGTKDAANSPRAVGMPGAADMRTTEAHVFFGTPFYMAPEQAKDAANVDARADIYSLGCTLYALLTGRPPFTGKTVVEVLSKHAATPITPPEKISPRIAGSLSAIVIKMMAKRVEERYQSMAQVINDLEEHLGVATAGPFRPKEEHVKIVSYAAERFNDGSWAKLRPKLILSFYAACFLGAIASVFLFTEPAWRVGMAGGLIGFGILTTVIYQLTAGITGGTFLFRKVRQLAWSAGPIEWLKWLVILAVVGYLLYSFGLLASWVIFGVLAAGVAIGFYFSVDLLRNKQRKAPIEQTETLVKQMRIKGLEENTLRQFVCRYAGNSWEEFYEAQFGYEGKMTARRMWGRDDRGHERIKFATWRDGVIRWIDHKIDRKKQLKEQKYLAKLEAKSLAAKGINEKLAAKQAAKAAQRFVEKASVVREASVKRSAMTVMPTKADRAASLAESVVVVQPGWMDDDSSDETDNTGTSKRKHQSAFGRRYGSPIDWIFGQKLRFVLGVLVLAGFAMWWNQNGGQVVKKEASDMMATREEVTETVLIDPTKAISTTKDFNLIVKQNVPLRIAMVPTVLTDAVGSWGGAVAGAILAIGALFSARLVGFTVLLAAAVALFGTMFTLPVIGQPQVWLCNIVATGVALFGMFWFRGRPA